MGASKTKAVGGTPTTQLGKDYTSFLNQAVNGSNGFQSTLDNLMSGSSQTPFNQYLNSIRNAGSGNSIPNVAGVSAAPVGNLDFSSLFSTNHQAPLSNINLGSLFNNYAAPNINMPSAAPQVTPYQGSARTPTDFNSPNVQAIMQMAKQSLNNSVNDLRERFTAQGGGAGQGTAGAYGEAMLRASAVPQLTNALAQFSQNESGLDLQNKGIDVNALLQNQALNQNSALTSRGQDIGVMATNAANQLQAMGLDANTASQLAGLMVQQGGMNQNAQLATNQLNSSNAGQLAQMLFNQNQLGQQNNQFNAGNQQQADLANQQAAMQMLAQHLNYNLGLGGLMNNSNSLTQQGQMAALQQMFGGLNQQTALATPQAQMVQKPSTFSQITGLATNLAGMGAGLAMGGINPLSLFSGLGGMFGGGGNSAVNAFQNLANNSTALAPSMTTSGGSLNQLMSLIP